MLGQGTLPASGQTTPAVGLVLGATATMAPAELGSLSLGPALAPVADLLAAAAPAVAAPLALSGDTPADPNAMTGASVIGRNDLSAYVGNGQVNVYTTAPALGGLMSSVTGSTTLQVVPGAAPAAPSRLVDTQGNTVGLLQNGQITLTAGGIPALDGNTMPPTVNLGGALSASGSAAAGNSVMPDGATVRLGTVSSPASLIAGGGFTAADPMPSSPPPLIPPQMADQPEGFTPAPPMATSTAGEIPIVNLGPLIFDPPDLQIPIVLEASSNDSGAQTGISGPISIGDQPDPAVRTGLDNSLSISPVTSTVNLGQAVAADSERVTVTQEGLDTVTNHLAQFGENEPNSAMIVRLEDQVGSEVTGADGNFYTHELLESEFMGSGMDYDSAHAAALDEAGVSPFSVYHPDVIQQFPDYFNSNWRAYWGLE